MRRVLLYVPLSNCHRLPIFREVALEEKKAGSLVYIFISAATPLLDADDNASLNVSAIISHLDPLIYRKIYVAFPGVRRLWKVLRRDRIAQEEFTSQQKLDCEDLLKNKDFDSVYLWNGNFAYQSDFLSIAQSHGLDIRFMEVAWFDQSNTYYVDPEGVNGGSEIAKAVTHELDGYYRRGQAFCEAYWRKKLAGQAPTSEYVLVPLQVETDSNIRLYSPFKSMEEFIDELAKWMPKAQKVIVRKHPKSSMKTFNLPEGFSWSEESDLFKDIAGAKCVIGINSTVLLQSLAVGKPVIAMGEGVWGENAAIMRGNTKSEFVWPKYDESAAFNLIGYLVGKQKYYDQKIFARQKKMKRLLITLQLVMHYIIHLMAHTLLRKKNSTMF